MKSKIFKSVLSIGLAAILLLTSASLSFAAGGSTVSGSAAAVSGNAAIKGKDEVIYAILAWDGSVRAMYAINHFAIAEAGSITDFGDYTSVENLTDTAPMAHNDDAVTVQTNAENFYYQGNMAGAELPWILDIGYSLDGVDIAPQELAGKSGVLDIHVATKQNTSINPVFYDNYMLQISITLDTEKCSDINAPGATLASAGKNKIIAYTVMPGKDANILLSATVKDFTMTGIDISAIPFSMSIEMPDTDSMINDFTDLSDAISDLNDGVGDLLDGVADLQSGSDQLQDGSSDIKQGLEQLSGNSGQLIDASKQIKEALSQISSSLSGGLGGDLGDMAQLPLALAQLAQGLRDISAGLTGLKDGFTPAYTALDGAMQNIPDAPIDPASIAALYTGDPGHDAVVAALVDSYVAAQTAKGTYNSVKAAFDAVGPTLDTLTGSISSIADALDQMSEEISPALSDFMSQMQQLADGLTQLSDNYGDFHNGLTDYMSGLNDLTNGYEDFHSGVSALSSGVGELYDGVEDLHDGTTELHDETAKMPDTIQSEIDDMLDQYTSSDFEPTSFTSPKNNHTDLVQFVLKCDGVEKPEETKGAEAEAGLETFWDRLIALFTGKKDD